MNKTPYVIELETRLMKAWAETVFQEHDKLDCAALLEDLNQKIHSGYDFNSDPNNMTLKVSSMIKRCKKRKFITGEKPNQIARKDDVGKAASAREIPCPNCYGGHFRPCQWCGDTGRVTLIPNS